MSKEKSGKLDKEFSYYLEHQNELVEKYRNRFLTIVGEKVVGDYDTYEQAVIQSKKNYERGTFLIQECTEGDSAYTMRLYSSVAFR